MTPVQLRICTHMHTHIALYTSSRRNPVSQHYSAAPCIEAPYRGAPTRRPLGEADPRGDHLDVRQCSAASHQGENARSGKRALWGDLRVEVTPTLRPFDALALRPCGDALPAVPPCGRAPRTRQAHPAPTERPPGGNGRPLSRRGRPEGRSSRSLTPVLPPYPWCKTFSRRPGAPCGANRDTTPVIFDPFCPFEGWNRRPLGLV